MQIRTTGSTAPLPSRGASSPFICFCDPGGDPGNWATVAYNLGG